MCSWCVRMPFYASVWWIYIVQLCRQNGVLHRYTRQFNHANVLYSHAVYAVLILTMFCLFDFSFYFIYVFQVWFSVCKTHAYTNSFISFYLCRLVVMCGCGTFLTTVAACCYCCICYFPFLFRIFFNSFLLFLFFIKT